jgi:hypothetical protein
MMFPYTKVQSILAHQPNSLSMNTGMFFRRFVFYILMLYTQDSNVDEDHHSSCNQGANLPCHQIAQRRELHLKYGTFSSSL